MACKDICIRYKAKKIQGARYANGQVRCQVCGIFMRWNGTRCPCCGYRVRHKPRNKMYRDRFRREISIGIAK